MSNASQLFKFTYVGSGKETFLNLGESIDNNTMYVIPETKEVYFGQELVASQNVEIVESIPETAGINGHIYVVTEGDDKGIYQYLPAREAVPGTEGTPAIPAVPPETDGEGNEIEGTGSPEVPAVPGIPEIPAREAGYYPIVRLNSVTVENFDPEAIATTIREAAEATDSKFTTELAVRTLVDDKVTECKTYTDDEIKKAIAISEEGCDWKESVDTYDDIATTYPEPEDGWTVSCRDTNQVYRYDTETGKWINIFQADSNLVEASVDGVGGHSGLMTASMAEKLGKIEDGSEVNQMAYSKFHVNGDSEDKSWDLEATDKTDTLTITSGTGVTLTGNVVDITEEVEVEKEVEVPNTDGTEGTHMETQTVTETVVTGSTKELVVSTNLNAFEKLVKGEDQTITNEDGSTIVIPAEEPDVEIHSTDMLHEAIAKLEYRANFIQNEIEDLYNTKVDKTAIVSVIDETGTVDQVASAKAVYDAIAVVRI